MSVEKTVKKNWMFFAAIAVVAVLVALCMHGTFEPWGYQCCNWLDPNCEGCTDGGGSDEPEVIVEECASCAETTYPNCAGECTGGTEQRPVICQPKYTVPVQGGDGVWGCECQAWYPIFT